MGLGGLCTPCTAPNSSPCIWVPGCFKLLAFNLTLASNSVTKSRQHLNFQLKVSSASSHCPIQTHASHQPSSTRPPQVLSLPSAQVSRHANKHWYFDTCCASGPVCCCGGLMRNCLESLSCPPPPPPLPPSCPFLTRFTPPTKQTPVLPHSSTSTSTTYHPIYLYAILPTLTVQADAFLTHTFSIRSQRLARSRRYLAPFFGLTKPTHPKRLLFSRTSSFQRRSRTVAA